MPNLQFDSGVREYTLNGAVTVRFNPTDMVFAERLFQVFDELDARQERYTAEVEKTEDNKALFSLARAMDTEMRETINGIFGADVCTPLFGSMSVYAASGGLPVWCNLLLALIDEMDESFTAEKAKTNPRIQKYIKKYKR